MDTHAVLETWHDERDMQPPVYVPMPICKRAGSKAARSTAHVAILAHSVILTPTRHALCNRLLFTGSGVALLAAQGKFPKS